MRTLVLIGFLSGFYLSFYGGQKVGLSLLLQQAHADVPDVNRELERLRGFAEQEKEDREFNQERLSGVSETKKNRQDWEKKQAASLPEYKLWKAKEGHTPDENSPEYREDLKARTLSHQESAEDRLQYAAQELKFRQELARKRPLKECQEYDVCGVATGKVEADRVPQKARLMYGNKPDYLSAKLSITGGGSSGTVTNEFTRGAGEYAPAPPPGNTGGPEFYEPEIPPPPPPPMPEGGFDDQVPPPIFDDPGGF